MAREERYAKSPGKRLGTFAIVLAVAITVSIMASGCGDGFFDMGEGHHDQMHGAAGGAPQTPVAVDASQVDVEIADFDFSPRELTVQAGATIRWTNGDSAPHDATDEADGWGTGTLKQGESATITFDAPGTYAYFCTIHPDMKATLAVEETL